MHVHINDEKESNYYPIRASRRSVEDTDPSSCLLDDVSDGITLLSNDSANFLLWHN